jgi:Lhr-like helicase
MNQGVGWYHSKMSLASRDMVRQGLFSGKVRVVVSTSALAMGVNLPTSHVIIRDLTFPGVKHLSTAEIMQMIGRAEVCMEEHSNEIPPLFFFIEGDKCIRIIMYVVGIIIQTIL